jgi:hypothetical protein
MVNPVRNLNCPLTAVNVCPKEKTVLEPIINRWTGDVKASSSVQELSQLKSYVDVLNIEGGLIPTCHFSKDKHQIWANLAAILDRPLLNGIDLDEITKSNVYPLKESSIPEYNEAKVCLAHALFLKYYIGHAREIAEKSNREDVKIVIQVHRGSQAKLQIKNLESTLEMCFNGEFKRQPLAGFPVNVQSVYKSVQKQVVVEFRFGYAPSTIGNYEDADIVLSLSLVAGLSEKLPSGSLVIPQKFVPMSLDDMVMKKSEEYEASNHLAGSIPDILQEQSEEFIAAINTIFRSPNPAKESLKATTLKVADFNPVSLLQVDGLFNPKTLPKEFSIQ